MIVQEPAPNQNAPVEFEQLLVIVGGGSVRPDVLLGLHERGGRLVGADGGADTIVAAGLKPELIVGDFDSLDEPMKWLGRTRLMQIGEQDTTDFEKALYSTRAPVTVALGMTGGRLDHTLAAVDAMARYGRDRTIILVDETDIAVGVSGPFSFIVERGARVSVHPLSAITFSGSTGLQFPLNGLTLAPGGRLGTSNRAVEGAFSIMPDSEVPYLVLVERDYLLRLIDHLIGK